MTCSWGLQVRKRHSEFPIATGATYRYNQPTATAHIGEFLKVFEDLTKLSLRLHGRLDQGIDWEDERRGRHRKIIEAAFPVY